MNFNKHFDLEGKHAFLSASKYHWINYDEEKLDLYYENYVAAERGTRLHAFAKECILLHQKLPNTGLAGKKTLNHYVNDAIAFDMTPEQPLYYSDYCFGTADAISFKNNILRIHDLKTGVSQVHMEQLMVYSALFCLEYGEDPDEIEIELRIYQNDDVWIFKPDPNDIKKIMNTIIVFSDRISKISSKE